eukprot:c10842_g1_i2.p1 GENE.c10842_g1_i2~~c10842_g1_i2.p1  ORF type:complete len:320 (+),score=27.23 c10842_g1_i2:594-1553(+)
MGKDNKARFGEHEHLANRFGRSVAIEVGVSADVYPSFGTAKRLFASAWGLPHTVHCDMFQYDPAFPRTFKLLHQTNWVPALTRIQTAVLAPNFKDSDATRIHVKFDMDQVDNWVENQTFRAEQQKTKLQERRRRNRRNRALGHAKRAGLAAEVERKEMLQGTHQAQIKTQPKPAPPAQVQPSGPGKNEGKTMFHSQSTVNLLIDYTDRYGQHPKDWAVTQAEEEMFEHYKIRILDRDPKLPLDDQSVKFGIYLHRCSVCLRFLHCSRFSPHQFSNALWRRCQKCVEKSLKVRLQPGAPSIVYIDHTERSRRQRQEEIQQ